MNPKETQSDRTLALIKNFLKQFQVGRMSVRKTSGIDDQTVADVSLLCLGDNSTHCKEDYQVSFKLQGRDVEICDYLICVEACNEFEVSFSDKASSGDAALLHEKIKRFLTTISPRVREAQKEQEIQCIPFVDNTFVLYGKTTFKVLSDDGEGNLAIDILGELTNQELKMSSHGLLDGLYTGAIKEVLMMNG